MKSKWIAILGLLLFASVAKAQQSQTVTNTYGTYTASQVASYDPSVGTWICVLACWFGMALGCECEDDDGD